MHIHCPSCATQVVADDIHLDTGMAKCRRCHAVFGIHQQLAALGATTYGAPPRKRPQLPLPDGLQVDEWGSELTLCYAWRTWDLLPLMGFCLFWNGFLVVWYSVAFMGDVNDAGFWAMVLFPVMHLAVGVGIGYGVLTGLVNSTTIRVGGGEVVVRNGPLPTAGNVSLATHAIRQLFVTHAGEAEGDPSVARNKSESSFDLVALQTDGTRQVLASCIPSRDMAGYIEQRLEAKLKIDDEPVPGEIDW